MPVPPRHGRVNRLTQRWTCAIISLPCLLPSMPSNQLPGVHTVRCSLSSSTPTGCIVTNLPPPPQPPQLLPPPHLKQTTISSLFAAPSRSTFPTFTKPRTTVASLSGLPSKQRPHGRPRPCALLTSPRSRSCDHLANPIHITTLPPFIGPALSNPPGPRDCETQPA